MSAFLAARDVTYRADGKPLVASASLGIACGEVVAIVGPNGAGKSTLLKLLAGELVPDEGGVHYDDRPVPQIPIWRLACLRAVLPQISRLFLPLRVAEVAGLGLDGIGRRGDAELTDRRLADALDRAEVSHLAARNYQTLSGGEQQRVQFARVLCQLAAGRTVEPRQALLLDEPTANLDLSHQLALLEAACALAADGVAVAVVLHDLNLAAAFADRIVAMRDGAIVARGRPGEVLTDALMRDVFGVSLRVGDVPDAPFVLPRRQ